jgi:amino acid permease
VKPWGEILAYSLVIALGIILVLMFSLFWFWGGALAYEHNRVALGLETALGVVILCFGLGSLVNLILKERRKRRHES